MNFIRQCCVKRSKGMCLLGSSSNSLYLASHVRQEPFSFSEQHSMAKNWVLIMGSYKRSKYAMDIFRNFTSEIAPKGTRHCASTMCLNYKAKPFEYSSHSASFQKLGFSSRTPRYNHSYQYNPFRGGSKRFYSVDLLQNFGFNACLGAAIIALYFRCIETVPLTQRTRFLLPSSDLENYLGYCSFEVIKRELEGKILPASHPESIRICLLTQEIINSLHTRLGIEKVCSTDVRYASIVNSVGVEDSLVQFVQAKDWKEDKYTVPLNKLKKSAISHLEGLTWEVLVVDYPLGNACSMPEGKIVVYTGLLEQLKSDAAISFVLGHEVGHVVARHSGEKLARELILPQRFLNALDDKHEMEADSIGMLLLAGAGYDPRVSPKALEKLVKIAYAAEPTHPEVLFTDKRVQSMAKGRVMKKALEIYSEAQDGRGAKGIHI